MMFLGDVENPQTHKTEVNLEGAREVIDLLGELKTKTEGNVSSEEMEIFNSLLPELQMKYSRQV